MPALSQRLAAILLLGILATTCSARAAEPDKTYSDPAAYCAAVGTIDRPDARYTGVPVPDSLARALMAALRAPAGAPLSVFKRMAWRCADGRILACSYGANIACDEKADRQRTAPTGARRFCREQPGADAVPAFATGHATIYQWRCDGTEPRIARQILQVDRQGYAAAFWHRIDAH